MVGISLFMGIIWSLCGICFLVYKPKFKSENVKRYFLAFVFLIFGVAGLAGALFKNDKLASLSTFIACGIFVICVCVKQIYDNSKCKTPIMAMCIGNKRTRNARAADTYTPIFAYTYKGYNFQEQGKRGYTFRKFYAKFQIGQPCTIYIDEKRPTIIADGNGLGAGMFWAIFFGIVLVAAGILVCMPGVEVSWK